MECRSILVTTQWEPAVKIRYLVKVGGSESLCRITGATIREALTWYLNHTVAKAQGGGVICPSLTEPESYGCED